MKIFTLAIDQNKEVTFSGDLGLQEVKNIVGAIIIKQAFEAGIQMERQRIRQGFRAKRKQREADRPA